MGNKRKLIIAGNWKMNHNIQSTVGYLDRFVESWSKQTRDAVDIVVCPPFTALAAAAESVKGSQIAIGAQNVHWESEGAFTGEISPLMLKELSVQYAIVGHSERRQYFGESDEAINRRLQSALRTGILPIVCVGETLDERESNKTEEIISSQITGCLHNIVLEMMQHVTIAYEPVWAIGTGVTANPDQAQEVHSLIRSLIEKKYSKVVADAIRIQYGGSVKINNVQQLMCKPDIDGALVGGASVKPDEFGDLIRNAITD